MESQPDLDKLIKQTRRYEFEDGLRDFQMAVLFALSGLSIWLAFEPVWIVIVAKAVQWLGRWAAWIGMLPVALPLLAVWGALPLMNYIRRTWLWRETGTVAPQRWQVSRRVNFLAALILLGGLGLAVGLHWAGWATDVFVLQMLWAATGWSFGYTLLSLGQELGLTRYVWVGRTGGLLSTLLLFLSLSFGQTGLALGLLWAGLLAGSGALALRRVTQTLAAGRR